ncbi:hypothetical protein SPBR_05497 [Sporothrix brasiliensis 5110]|uniref:non-specific serine/threonine protein kinase n=1 Tax=Sporothrix brasiliensis 5110 TaxID=1398154 RepID=A0A0C2JBS7_9PEZI|nr:uncharacterized protein SPBR_05497 [Sporothrix brasiliensis 5110]KIH94342.1 hypothetical protein SPBR_05497 [Sporothrix brasiliensis 5110]
MEPEHPRPSRPHHHPHLLNLLPVTSVSSPSSPQPGAGLRATGITPASSPGVVSPQQHSHSSPHVPTMASMLSATSASAALAAAAGSSSASATVNPLPGTAVSTPPSGFSHEHSPGTPRQPVRETHIATVDRDFTTGRKTINEYQVLEEIGRGQHGKVKLAQDRRDQRMVAIKIIPRLSKTRRLGKVSAVDPQQNTKREIAILKKIRHENIVALLEVIDDPELQKIYMVLEYVERGEMTWRKKGLPNICYFERYRFEQGVHGHELAPGECNWHAVLERKATIRALKDARANGTPLPVNEWTTVYHVSADDEDGQPPWWYVPSTGLGPDASLLESHPISRATSRAPSRIASSASVASAPTRQSYSSDASPLSYMAQDGGDRHTLNFVADNDDEDDDAFGGDGGSQTPGLLHPANAMSSALDGSMFGAYVDDSSRPRQRSPSIADSVMSHLSGIDFNSMVHDPYADDFSYVPCFNIHQARIAFRDTVLGLEYLHYHGVVHRDIKPANLLWSKGFHVKISDFGVSYFGRPIRDGEPDVTVSEAEARNFDDDRELSKTVGTPAFFAPELCYTDIDTEPPRVSEQIDVWSLGVTLYCLLYARIPFLAEDEFSMFRKIATEEAYIPKRRLKPVGIYTDPTGSSLYSRTNVHPYRSDADPEYEEISDSLLDLLRKMLIKNPDKRIRLKDIKRHPWVTEDLPNVAAWLSDTDPARDQDRTIHVDEEEIGDAVVPLNFLQRARSAVKRAVDKVMHARPERDESAAPSSTRARAASSAASSSRAVAGDQAAAASSQPINILPATLQHHNSTGSPGNSNHGHVFGFGSHGHSHSHGHMHSYSQGHQPASSSPLGFHHYHTGNNPRDARRKSLHKAEVNDYFATVTQLPPVPGAPGTTTASAATATDSPRQDHPLAQSQTASPYASPDERTPHSEFPPSQLQQLTLPETSATEPAVQLPPAMPAMPVASTNTVYNYNIDGSGEASPATPPSRTMTRHVHSRSISNAILSRASILRDIQTMPPTPTAALPLDASTSGRRTREVRSASSADITFNARTRSVDRAGIVFANPDKRAEALVGLSVANAPGSMRQPSLHLSTSTVGSDETETETLTQTQTQTLVERPATAHRVQDIVANDITTAVGRGKSNSLSALPNTNTSVDASAVPLTNAGLDTTAAPTSATTTSSSSASLEEGFNQTPLTSPSEKTHHSFVHSTNSTTSAGSSQPGHRKGSSNAMMTMVFQSDPSLPALLSGASSVSNDVEGEFLGNPGVVGGPGDVSDSLTPPALLGKEPAAFPLGLKDQQGWGSGGAIPVEIDNTAATARAAATGRSTSTSSRTPLATPVRGNSRCFTDEDDDSDSDGGIIMMAKAKKKVTAFGPMPGSGGSGFAGSGGFSGSGSRTTHMARRRDTSTSIGSTDTAKKVGLGTTTTTGDN